MNLEEELKRIIIERYGTCVDFAKACGIPNSTLQSILCRGVNKSSINNVIKICDELKISADALSEGIIVEMTKKNSANSGKTRKLSTILQTAKNDLSTFGSVTVDGIPLTQEEIDQVKDVLDFSLDMIKRKRNRAK